MIFFDNKFLIRYNSLKVQVKSHWMTSGFDVKNNKFCIENWDTRPGTVHYFDNFAELIKYLNKGNFYQGRHFRLDYYLFDLVDGKTCKITKKEISK